MFTFRNVRILFAAALLAAIFCLAGCSTAAQAVPQPAETSRSAFPWETLLSSPRLAPWGEVARQGRRGGNVTLHPPA